MIIDHIEMERVARLERARAIGGLIAAAIAWVRSHTPRARHASGPHFAR